MMLPRNYRPAFPVNQPDPAIQTTPDPYLNNTDPLGLATRQRASDTNQAYQNGQQGVSFGHLGPLTDPAWDAFKQILHEKHARVGGIGLPNSPVDAHLGQPILSALQGLAPAGQVIGAPGDVSKAPQLQTRGPLAGLQRGTQPYETHEEFMKRYGR